jgi:hypothetical protein
MTRKNKTGFMKKFIFTFVCSLMMSLTVFASGTSVGNGGMGISCKNFGDNSSSPDVQLFDFFEGDSLYDLTPTAYTGDYKELARKKMSKIGAAVEDESIANFLQYKLEDLFSHFTFLPAKAGLKFTEDMDNFIIPKNCEFVQLVNYRENSSVYVDSVYWNLLSDTDKAGLVVHEVIYAYLRNASEVGDHASGMFSSFEKDSSRVRKIVALLFADKFLPGLGIKTFTPKSSSDDFKMYCSNDADAMATTQGHTEFFLIKSEGQYSMRFRTLSGRTLLTRGEAVFHDFAGGLEMLTLNSLVDEASFTVHAYDVVPKTEISYPSTITIREPNRQVQYTTHFKCSAW